MLIKDSVMKSDKEEEDKEKDLGQEELVDPLPGKLQKCVVSSYLYSHQLVERDVALW